MIHYFSGGYLTLLVSGLRPGKVVLVFIIGTFKTVCDHSNFRYPVNPVYGWFSNNSFYHDVHH